MERRINKKIENYLSEFKENVRAKALELGSKDPGLQQLVQYIYDYDRLNLGKEDFMKRKRVKNVVHLSDRCCAKRANGEQCTRRRKDDTTEFCGTHLKGTPHGICDLEEENKPQGQKIEVWAQDIQGIVYYIDKASNVYQVEDIMQGKVNPKIIAKYVKVGEVYSIPEFNI
jgi:hypothetical protein